MRLNMLLLKSIRELDSPLVLKLRHAQERSADDRDDDRSQESEDTFPDVLGTCEGVRVQAVESTDHAGADDETDENAQADAEPDLFTEFSV